MLPSTAPRAVGFLSPAGVVESAACLNKSLKGKFSDNISWYAETVKLDLEGRKKIERTSSKPQKYRLTRAALR